MTALTPLPTGYGQLCPVAVAVDQVGQRWTLLILRDLARAPLRFSDLEAINPGISPTLLTQRLRSLEADGLVERTVQRSPARTTLYSITESARKPVQGVLSALAELGAHMVETGPLPDDPVGAFTAQMQLNSHFVMARGSNLRGYFVFDVGWLNHLVIDDEFTSSSAAPAGRSPDATATIFPPTTLMRIMGRTLTVDEAETLGLLTITGDRAAMMELIGLLSFAG